MRGEPNVRRGLVIGCGGTLGFAWSAVALAALEDQLDWDVRTAEVLVGTSAGAEMAAILGSGLSVGDVVEALSGAPSANPLLAHHLQDPPGMLPPRPALRPGSLGLTRALVRRRVDLMAGLAGLLPRGRGDAGWLRSFGAALALRSGSRWVPHPATWLVAADASTGQRVAFGSPGAPAADLGQAIAASWAIPGWFPAVEIGDAKYVDGGTVSPASADLLASYDVDEVVIVAPMTTDGGAPATGLSRVERLMRRAMTARLDAEVRQLWDAGKSVIRVEPGPDELAAMGANFMDLRRRPATLEAAATWAPKRVTDAIERGRTAGRFTR